MRALVAGMLFASGCANLLGLDSTTFDQRDAPTDSPSVCDGLPAACVATGGRTICGQLRGTGTAQGTLIRGADPTGALCITGGDGPCAFSVTGRSTAAYFSGDASNAVTGTIDDCGRFAILDPDPMGADVAAIFDAPGYQEAASLVLGRTGGPGVDTIDAYPVATVTASAWSAQVNHADASTGYLVRYTAGTIAIAGEQVAHDGSSPLTMPFGMLPWAAYFSDELGNLDSTLTATAAPGLAFTLIDATAMFELDGFRTGRRCRVMALKQVPNALIYVVATNC